MLLTLPDAVTNSTIISKESQFHDAVINNIKILDNIKILNQNNKWCQLQFFEAYYIKTLAAKIYFDLYSP